MFDQEQEELSSRVQNGCERPVLKAQLLWSRNKDVKKKETKMGLV